MEEQLDHTGHCCQACFGLPLWSAQLDVCLPLLDSCLCKSTWNTESLARHRHQNHQHVIFKLECILCVFQRKRVLSGCTCSNALLKASRHSCMSCHLSTCHLSTYRVLGWIYCVQQWSVFSALYSLCILSSTIGKWVGRKLKFFIFPLPCCLLWLFNLE